MSHGFNTDKSNANIEDMIKIQQITVLMDYEIPPYVGAEMGGYFNLTGKIPAGYKPVGIVSWNLPQCTCLRTCTVTNNTVPYNPNIQYGIAYTLTNLTAVAGKKNFDVFVLLLKVTD